MATESRTFNINLGYVFIGTAVAALVAREVNILPSTLWWIAGTFGVINIAIVLAAVVPMLMAVNNFGRMKLNVKNSSEQSGTDYASAALMTLLQAVLMYSLGMQYLLIAFIAATVIMYGFRAYIKNKFA